MYTAHNGLGWKSHAKSCHTASGTSTSTLPKAPPSKQQQSWYFHASLGEDTILWCVSISGRRDDFKQFKHTQPHRNLSLQDLGQMKIIMDQHAATSRIYRRHRKTSSQRKYSMEPTKEGRTLEAVVLCERKYYPT